MYYRIQVSGHPRNDVQLGGSFLTVERQNDTTGGWEVVATDANWETRYLLYICNTLNTLIYVSHLEVQHKHPNLCTPRP